MGGKTCPNCGSAQVPYPLSTNPACGDPNYHLRCDPHSQKLYFDAMNGSSYLVLRIMASFQLMVVQPPPWVSAPSSACVTQDMSSGRVDKNRALNCAGNPDLNPCCTFVAGGMPSAYKIRLHNSGCKAFRSILRLDPKKPASQWEEGVEIQWASPPEPVCNSKLDCSGASKCLPAGTSGLSRCLCNRGYNWDHVRGTCLGNKHKSKASGLLSLEVSIGVISFISFAALLVLISVRRFSKRSNQAKLAKAREDMLKSSESGRNAKMFQLKEAIDFSRDQDDVNLAIYVSQAAKNGAIMEVVDRRLIGAEPSGDVLSSVRLFSELAFSCLREKKADRPGMREVVQQLERIVQTVLQCSEL
ncbi:WALL-ASSOCIATED RECEPTOR KINASE-LIKE PROTEIN [Salix viminalis]|uniref:WALL-ASSOCIATED RECEPTOR KINASE-LIKE PROTEIN n=1 Tax=Salix viminalis TaxID=40686 RepID=A0A9Q0ZPX6_SALVM|nr:WALL-ASSOCIATED RECEPTOR KINASE-LIKE PROTEIN [Salix viminalis]